MNDFYTIVESIHFFPILGFVNIMKSLVVHEIIEIGKDFWDRLYLPIYG